MHALALLAAFVDPYAIFYRQAVLPPRIAARFGDEPNPEARLFARDDRDRLARANRRR